MRMQMPISVQFPLRQSWSDPVPLPRVSFHSSTLLVDEHKIPQELAPLIPLRSARWAPEEWRAFCERAVVLGIM